MKKTVLLINFLLALLLLSLICGMPAYAAQGIVAAADTGGGTIMITDPSASAPMPTTTSTTGGPTTPGTGAPAPDALILNPGDAVPFFGNLTGIISPGDLVGFNITTDPATGALTATDITKLADGSLISGNVAKVTVGPGRAALITNADIRGNLRVLPGAVLLMAGTNMVRGKIKIRGAKLAIIIGGTTAKKKGEVKDVIKIKILDNKGTFKAKFTIKNSQEVVVADNHFQDRLTIKKCRNVAVNANAIDKELEIESAEFALVEGNTIGGDLELENVADYFLDGNTVGGKTEIH